MQRLGIIFDVDGTLWDSSYEVTVSWNKGLEAETDLGISFTRDQLTKEFGKPMDEIADDIFPGKTREEKNALMDILFRYENAHVVDAPCILYPGLAETFAELSKKYPLYIVSNCQAGYVEAFLENTKLGEYVVDHTCPGDTGMLKGDNILFIMEKYGMEKAVYVGDTQGDYNACKHAGIPMIFASYGFGSVDDKLPEIKELRELLDFDFDSLF
ncbi:MAG: HAD family hydrolase [Dorea sp.]|nr:HAD family hydrolase [Dorea sp.]